MTKQEAKKETIEAIESRLKVLYFLADVKKVPYRHKLTPAIMRLKRIQSELQMTA